MHPRHNSSAKSRDPETYMSNDLILIRKLEKITTGCDSEAKPTLVHGILKTTSTRVLTGLLLSLNDLVTVREVCIVGSLNSVTQLWIMLGSSNSVIM